MIWPFNKEVQKPEPDYNALSTEELLRILKEDGSFISRSQGNNVVTILLSRIEKRITELEKK